ncbi:MAG: hypothetical protein ACU0BF_02820 [Paracoccaceae bacterium]
MQIAFHIGALATDSDRLLQAAQDNAARAPGTHVPGPARYRPLVRETVQGLAGRPAPREAREVLLDAMLDAEEPDRLILSHDLFLGVPNRVLRDGAFHEVLEEKVGGFASLFREDEIELFICLRDIGTWLPAVHAATTNMTFAQMLGRLHPSDLRWSEVVARLRAAAPRAAVTVWCHEDRPIVWPDVLRAILGLAGDAAIDGGLDPMAEALAPEGRARLAHELAQTPPDTVAMKRRMYEAVRAAYPAPGAAPTPQLAGWTPELTEHLTAIYEADLETIADMEGVTLIEP